MLEGLRQSLNQFLESPHAGAFLVHGDWGTGKTHFWQNYIHANLELTTSGLTKYSYVSLFGITSIHDLLSEIFSNAVSPDPDSRLGPQTLSRNLQELYEDTGISENSGSGKGPIRRFLAKKLPSRTAAYRYSRHHIQALAKTPRIGFLEPFIRSAVRLSVRNHLICFDDLERISSSLPMRDVLGLIAQLTNEKDCKVVVIANRDALRDSDKDELDRLREKVFDHEMRFIPDLEDCCDLVFRADPAWVEARNRVEQLGIRNIRVLRRIRTTIEAFRSHLSSQDHASDKALVASAVILTWAYNSQGPDVPAYKWLKDPGASWMRLLRKPEEVDPQQEKIERLVFEYGYYSADELDQQICHFLENGFIDQGAFKKALSEKQRQQSDIDAHDRMREAWRYFHSTFADNTSAFVNALAVAIRSSMSRLPLQHIDHGLTTLRALGEKQLAKCLRDTWINDSPDQSKLKQVKHFGDELGKIEDPDLQAEMERLLQLDKPKLSVFEALYEIAMKRGRFQDARQALIEADEQEYVAFLEKTESDDLGDMIRAALELDELQDNTFGHQKIAAKMRSALVQVGRQSPLNRIRCRRFGVDPDAAE